MAERRWRQEGARSASEMRSFVVSRCYRRVGLWAVQAFARHRLDRVPYVGVRREIVLARPPRRAMQRAPPPAFAYEFYAYQAGPMVAAA